jgi:hypothetical protein
MPLDFAVENSPPALQVVSLAHYRLSDRSTRFRLLPTFLTAFFTAAFERPVFRAS